MAGGAGGTRNPGIRAAIRGAMVKGMKESDSQNIQDEEESSSFISNTLLLTDVEIKFRLVKT